MSSKYAYWGSTGLIAALMLFSGVMYFVADAPAETIERLGFPSYFYIQIGIAKIAGSAALLVPLPRSLKEWTYAGFTIDLGSAIVAHAAAGDPVSSMAMPAVMLAVLLTSYASYHQYYLLAVDDEAANA